MLLSKANHNTIDKLNKYFIIGGYCFFLSILFLLICTKSSPLYPFNDWVDSNAFFTMGKGMINGKVLYRDLFEQKGPLLYFIHGLSYLISNKTFLGVFIFEVFSFSFFLLYCNKIISLYFNKKYSFITLPFIAAIVLNMPNFSHGDSAEEYCLPLITISLYYLIAYFKNKCTDFKSYKWLLINGIIAGSVLWIKYSMLGFWFGWMLVIFISMIVKKQYLKSIKSSIIFWFGMFISTIPWIAYFSINNSIFSWLDTYILINIKYYAKSLTVLERLRFIFENLFLNSNSISIFSVICCIGLLYFINSKRFIKSILGRISLIFCGLMLALGVYGGGKSYSYYFVIFLPFVIFAFLMILDLIKLKCHAMMTNRKSIIMIIISLVIIMPLTYKYNHNTYMLKINKEDLIQYEFASIINQTENATLLNYGCLDIGLYTATGITPNVRFFEQQNISYSQYTLIMDEQNRYIKDKEVDYVVLRQNASFNLASTKIPYLLNNYELLKVETQMFEGMEFKYLLFKRNKT